MIAIYGLFVRFLWAFYVQIMIYLLRKKQEKTFRFMILRIWEPKDFLKKYGNPEMELDEVHPDDVLPEQVI